MNTKYRKRLEDIGIAEKEAAVYLALLESGAATADQTAKAAKLNRSTTYVQLTSLINVGLVTTFKRGKKTFFGPESPENLERLVEMKQAKLELDKANINSFIPDLMKLFAANGNAPVIRLYEGKQGVLSLRKTILSSELKNLYIITDVDKFRKTFTKKERDAFSEERAKRKICSHVLYSASKDTPDIEPYPPQKLRRIKNKAYSFDSDIYIFDDKIAFFSLGDEVHGTLIHNRKMANTMATFFKLLWDSMP